ncbi:restriction endonuclease subunit S [Trichocoleus sp. FACHB-262]|uniref:restriction endonuclease subunit S n=1 Tax=Trichocoleus sp. FACHB-262 TaxID=2692869 RepID=UPI0019A0F18D|nr:restriction endonuclease subunit S [Trichocoleus sp. FACHB-262]MBD2122891.1 restriction endonuclease subunit S [Trichocoleus sp. FACHB-262]
MPNGWTICELREAVEVLDSQRVPVNSEERQKRVGSVPYYGATGQVGWIDEYLFDEELLLVGEDGAPFLDKLKPVAYLIQGKSWVNNHAHVVRAIAKITSNSFLKHYLNQFDFDGYVTGTTRLKLNQSAMNRIPLMLPPYREQQRIVAKLEKLLAKCEASKQRLDKIPFILKRFRQSILAAACSGRLTADLRKQLKINIEQDWRQKNLKDLLAEPLANGHSVVDAKNPEKSFPVLRLTCLKNGSIDLDERKLGDWYREDAKKFLVQEHDFLVARGNGSLALVGRGGLVRCEPDEVAYPDTLIRVRVNQEILTPKFLSLVWDSDIVREQVEASARTSAGIHKINQKSIESFVLPVPPIAEQQEIVERVEKLFALSDNIERRYRKARAYVDKLPQTILGKAFRGELVPQDPHNEPASILLERIQTERAERETKKEKATKGSRGGRLRKPYQSKDPAQLSLNGLE